MLRVKGKTLMADSFIFDKTSQLLGRSMSVAARKHSLITGNIANMDTIGYTPKDLDFKKTLQREMTKKAENFARTHPNHFELDTEAGLSATMVANRGNENSPDPVNIDTEMANLVENNIKYRSSVEMLLRKIGMLRQAITEGGR